MQLGQDVMSKQLYQISMGNKELNLKYMYSLQGESYRREAESYAKKRVMIHKTNDSCVPGFVKAITIPIAANT